MRNEVIVRPQKLCLGSGFNRMPNEDGWLNVDCEQSCEPDIVCVLDEDPWPWDSDSIDEVLFNHSLEHMGADVVGFRHVIRELYRVCENGASVQINVPHPRHDDFLNDPTHVRVITPELLGLLNREACAFFREQKAANTPLADYWGVNFKLEKNEQALDPRFAHWQGDPGLAKLITTQNNVIQEYRMTLRVVKS